MEIYPKSNIRQESSGNALYVYVCDDYAHKHASQNVNLIWCNCDKGQRFT